MCFPSCPGGKFFHFFPSPAPCFFSSRFDNLALSCSCPCSWTDRGEMPKLLHNAPSSIPPPPSSGTGHAHIPVRERDCICSKWISGNGDAPLSSRYRLYSSLPCLGMGDGRVTGYEASGFPTKIKFRYYVNEVLYGMTQFFVTFFPKRYFIPMGERGKDALSSSSNLAAFSLSLLPAPPPPSSLASRLDRLGPSYSAVLPTTYLPTSQARKKGKSTLQQLPILIS